MNYKMNFAMRVSILALIAGASTFYALAYTPPTQPPPNGNVSAPINTGSSAQIKNGKLSIFETIAGLTTGLQFSSFHIPGITAGGAINSFDADGTTVRPLALQTNGGNVGIGTNNPTAKFEVNGEIRPGTTNAPCTASLYGAVRYDKNTDRLQICNTTKNWTSLRLYQPIGTMMNYNLMAQAGQYPVAIGFDGTNMWTVNMSLDIMTFVTTGSVTKIGPTGSMTNYTLPLRSSAGEAPHAIASDGTNMWVVNGMYLVGGGSLTKVSPLGAMTNYIMTLPAGVAPRSIAFDGTNMWTANGDTSTGVGSTVTKISPAGIMTHYTLATQAKEYPNDIAFDGVNMWTANASTLNTGGGSVTKITPTGITTNYPLSLLGHFPDSIAFDGTNMWVASSKFSTPTGSMVTKVSPTGGATNYSLLVQAGESVYDIAFDGTNMWTANYSFTSPVTGSVTKISPTGTMVNYPLLAPTGQSAASISFDGVNMWTANATFLSGPGSVTQIQAI